MAIGINPMDATYLGTAGTPLETDPRQAANPLEFFLPWLFAPSGPHASGPSGWDDSNIARTGWNRADVDAANEFLTGNPMLNYLGPGDYRVFQSRVNDPSMTYEQWRTAVQNAIDFGQNQQARQAAQESLERTQGRARDDLDAWYNEIIPTIQKDIDRYGMVVNTKGGTRLDPEFAGALTGEESAINAAVRAAQQTASRAASTRGISGSGKLKDMAQQATIQGAAERDRLNSDFKDLAQQRLSAAERERAGVLRDYGAGKAAIDEGRFDRLAALSTYQNPYRGALFGDLMGTTTDLRGLNVGNDRANAALALQAILGFGQMAQNGMDSVMGMFKGGGK